MVVTAAHCVAGAVREGRHLLVRLGEMDTIRRSGCEQDIYVSNIVLHPGYSTNSQSHHDDIAVLHLRRSATLGPCVGTICLPAPGAEPTPGQQVRLAGWGLVAFNSDETAKQLKNPSREVLPLSSCSSAYPSYLLNAFYPGGLGTNKICVASGQNIPICKGDSGGPVVWFMPGPRRYLLVGVISVGIGCGADHPGINIRVAPYVQWILANR
ncbi:CLIP domain-containing serine protease 14D-like isoform X2 [Amphibalanus amphitrite]|nr:CLIP domain-containing serine protease 14D-like isoform X2 [Amphibalanus amphitrite]